MKSTITGEWHDCHLEKEKTKKSKDRPEYSGPDKTQIERKTHGQTDKE